RSDESGRVFLDRLLSSRACFRSSTGSVSKAFMSSRQRFTAGLRAKGDCAREFLLPMRPTVCFEAGRFTLTPSSWTSVPVCSRKWMSGHAAFALVVEQDRGQIATIISTAAALGKPFSLSRGKSPFSLDSYLSWMSSLPSHLLGYFPRLAA